MKRFLLITLILLALFACNKKESSSTPEPPVTPDTPVVSLDSLVTLTYDSENATVTAIPGDSVSSYVLQIWLVEDYILDYGNDFSDSAVAVNLASYLDLCIEWEMQFPIFDADETTSIYEWFDQPYYGYEHIAMAAAYDEQSRKINGPVTHIRFVAPEK